jgi:hypothetical protein
MPTNPKTRFDFAKPSGHVTRAIVIRGKGRFAIVRPDPVPSAIISRKDLDNPHAAARQRIGGLSLDQNANREFEAGMRFVEDRAA